jgi:hypothetical protein
MTTSGSSKLSSYYLQHQLDEGDVSDELVKIELVLLKSSAKGLQVRLVLLKSSAKGLQVSGERV